MRISNKQELYDFLSDNGVGAEEIVEIKCTHNGNKIFRTVGDIVNQIFELDDIGRSAVFGELDKLRSVDGNFHGFIYKLAVEFYCAITNY